MRTRIDKSAIKKDIRRIVEQQRMYRDIELTRRKIAEIIGCTEKRISEVMQEEFNSTFPIYINKVRAQHARYILRTKAHKDISTEDIALLSGFASRKSLHLAFLQTYGITIGEAKKIFKQQKNKTKKMIKAVLFDLDGTLVDTEDQYTVFWGKTSRKYRPDIDRLEYKIKGTTLTQILDTYFAPETHKEIVEELYKWEAQMDYSFYPHALDFIHDLKRNGARCAIVTSSDQAKITQVRKAIPDFDELFDRVLTAEDFTASKPDPDCYLRGAKAFDCSIDECVVFEDAFTGLKAGMSSGIFTIGMAMVNGREEITGKCNHVLDNYNNLTFNELQKIVNRGK